MREVGEVVEKKGSNAVVRFKGTSHCAGCKMGCSSKGKNRYLELADEIGVEPGDIVEVEFEEKRFIKGAFLSYVFPLIFFIAGYASGYLVSRAIGCASEVLPVAFSFLFLGLSYLFIKFLFGAGILESSYFEPRIVRKLKE